MEKVWEEWKTVVYPALESKVKEFETLGYKNIHIDEIWEMSVSQMKKRKADPALHTIVQTILHMKMHDYMQQKTIESYKKIEQKKNYDEALEEILAQVSGNVAEKVD
ncbi:Post-transcriptional regulator [Marinococcus luteus]|uniref:Post-transcriptional regulator n=1 Tax=Marinococcus luteus TaxID=1122204 RepID=A0A1H2S977_9BACI|nr:post-transcriptional regulator [Marinococcus luteus]SDW27539.1 Post-transcriptional regulator [Marinococcus luteus]